VLQHLIFDKQLSLLAELIAQVAEQSGGLVRDLASAQRLGDFGERVQLGANAETIRGGGGRHATEPT